MTQQEKFRAAKNATLERLPLDDFIQFGEYQFASLEQVGGEEIWVEVKISAKKSFDIDDAVEEFIFDQEKKREKAEKRAKSEQKTAQKAEKSAKSAKS